MDIMIRMIIKKAFTRNKQIGENSRKIEIHVWFTRKEKHKKGVRIIAVKKPKENVVYINRLGGRIK